MKKFAPALLFFLLVFSYMAEAQTGYHPPDYPTMTCDSMKVSGRWGWHDPASVPAGYNSEFSFLSFENTPAHPYVMFLFEVVEGENGQGGTYPEWGVRFYYRDDPPGTVWTQNTTYGEFHLVSYIDPQWFDTYDTAFYMATTWEQSELDNMNFYACYLTGAESPTNTPTSQPTNTPTATATPESISFTDCYDYSPIFIDGFTYELEIPANTSDFQFHVQAWGNASFTVTDPNNNVTHHDYFKMFPSVATLGFHNPAAGTWLIEFTGSPATYGNNPTAEICTETTATVTPTPGAGTPTANPTGTPTATATLEPTKEGPPTLSASTPTPAVWPTASIPTPVPVPTMPGCTAPNYFCGNYYAPVDGSVAEFEIEYDKTYCYQLIPEIGIINFPGFTLCLDTYQITASLFDIAIPIMIIFTIMAIIIIYKIIQS